MTHPQKPKFRCAFCRTREASIACPNCRYTVYCTHQHRWQHWHQEHQQHCASIAMECRIATQAVTLYTQANTPDAFKTLLQQFPHQYLSLRLYGRALLQAAARAQQEEQEVNACHAWTAALNFLLAAEHHAMRGPLVRSTESGLELYQDILYAAMRIQHCETHEHGEIAALIGRYQEKQRLFKTKAVRDLLQANVYPPEFTFWVTHAAGLRLDAHGAYGFWFKGYPMLRQLGFDRWSKEKQAALIKATFGSSTLIQTPA